MTEREWEADRRRVQMGAREDIKTMADETLDRRERREACRRWLDGIIAEIKPKDDDD